jgi:hypothetical protein
MSSLFICFRILFRHTVMLVPLQGGHQSQLCKERVTSARRPLVSIAWNTARKPVVAPGIVLFPL